MAYYKKILSKLIQNHGLFGTLWLLGKMLWYALRDRRFSPESANAIRNAVAGKRVIVFAKAIEWNNMFQRIQQLALAFSKLPDTVVIYVEKPTTYDFFANIERRSDTLFGFSFRHYDRLNELLAGASERVLYVTNLLSYEQSMTFSYDTLVYEYLDELEIFFDEEALPQAKRNHAEIAAKADLCVATASKLYDQIAPLAKRVILSPNAGDYAFFSSTDSFSVAPDIASRRDRYSLVIGYYGAIAAWFDYATILQAAKTHPDWLFVFVGVLFDDTKEKAELAACENILLPGAKPYAELPSYIAGMDLLTIPFVVNNVTMSTSPVKLFEYMASHRPILTSALPECKKYRSVETYTTAEEFIEKAAMLSAQKNDPERIALLDAEARENTWEMRASAIDRALRGEE